MDVLAWELGVKSGRVPWVRSPLDLGCGFLRVVGVHFV